MCVWGEGEGVDCACHDSNNMLGNVCIIFGRRFAAWRFQGKILCGTYLLHFDNICQGCRTILLLFFFFFSGRGRGL